MFAPLFSPGTLWPSIVRRTAHALDRGALCPIETVRMTLDDGGLRFVVRQVSSLAHKAKANELAAPSTTQADPFLPYDPDLFVADVSETHLALLNKFNVIDHHLLIVTRAFEEQEAWLDLADFTAWFACLAEFEGLGFYNSGAAAGASQRHKHMQIVPLPLGATDMGDASLPIEGGPGCADAATLAGFPFVHAFARLAPASVPAAAEAALACYLRLMGRLGLGAAADGKPQRPALPYNLLLTPYWMLLVPRTTERAEGISVNALGFAGSLFVRDAVQMETVRRLGPMALLERVAVPRGRKP